MLVILSGPVGVGKTRTGRALSALLQEGGTPHTLVDFDALTYTYPRAPDDPFGTRVALVGLAHLWRAATATTAQAPSRHLIVPRVIEDRREAEAIADATDHDAFALIHLTAPLDVLHARLRARETGAALSWHLTRAAELASSLPTPGLEGHVVQTDAHTPRQVAAEIQNRLSLR
ncbi:MAG: hypothetical protein AAFR93_17195 [Pseudomonadota bacterium]